MCKKCVGNGRPRRPEEWWHWTMLRTDWRLDVSYKSGIDCYLAPEAFDARQWGNAASSRTKMWRPEDEPQEPVDRC